MVMKGQAIYSVSRAQLNVLMMEMADKNGAKLYFNEKCVDANLEEAIATFENTNTATKTSNFSRFTYRCRWFVVSCSGTNG